MTVANVHIQQVLLRRGNTIQSSSYTGPIGEVILDTDLHTLRIQDGVTTGGVMTLATQAQIDTLTNNIITITGVDSNIVSEITNILNGNVTFGNLIPSADNTYNLGTPTEQWENLYLSGNSIFIGGSELSVINGNLTIGGNAVTGGTQWNIPVDGCPIYAELTADHFRAYTQNSHLDLENIGYWSIGSNANGSGIFGTDTDSTLYSNYGNVYIRTNDSQSYFIFDTAGTMTVPGIINLPYGSITTGFGPGISLLANVDANQYFTVMATGNATNIGQTLIFTEQNNIGFEIVNTENDNNYSWQFDSLGRTVLPGNIVFSDSTVQTTAGTVWTGAWDPEGYYTSNVSIVTYNGNAFIKIGGNGNSGSSPDNDNIRWTPFSTGSTVTGNIGFIGDAMYDLAGITIENADLSHGATAAVIIPPNGSNNSVQVNNTNGAIAVQAGTGSVITASWTFGTDGNLTLPGNLNFTASPNAISGVGIINAQYYYGDGSNLTNLPLSTPALIEFLAQVGNDTYAASTTDNIIVADSNGGFTAFIVLPSNPGNGKQYTIKKSTTFSSHPITVSAAGGANIEGSNQTISFNNPFGYITLVYDINAEGYWVIGGNYASV